MQTIRALKMFKYNGVVVNKDGIVTVENNDAFSLIDGGFAILESQYNKMMTPQLKKGYKVK